jgi:HAE1 family hydrophobic/amphiphilic exporter-1
VAGAVLSSTLTTVAVFLPVLFVKEEAGQLFADIALAISAGVGLSLVVSLTLVPMASARLVRGMEKRKGGSPSDNGQSPSDNGQSDGHPHHSAARPPSRGVVGTLLAPVDRFGSGFVSLVQGTNAWLQRGVVRRLIIVVGFVALSIGLSWMLMPKLEYLPTGNRNLVFGILLPPSGYSIEALTEIGEKIEKDLRPYWDVDPGTPEAAQLDHPIIRDFFFVARGRQVFLGMKAVDPERAGELVPLVDRVGKLEPATLAIGNQSSLFDRGLTAGRTIDVEIMGPDLKHLTDLGKRIMGQVSQVVPGCRAMPRPSLDLSSPELHVSPRRVQAAEMGMPTTQIGYATSALVDGAYAGDYYHNGVKIDLTIIAQKQYSASTQNLAAAPVAVPVSEVPVPLSSLASVDLAGGPEQINRRQRQRAVTVQVNVPPDIAVEDAMQRIEQQIVQPLMDSGELQGGLYQIELAGTADKLRVTAKALQFNLLLALLITYLLMAALFESWLYPFVVILSVPFGALGGFLGLSALNLWIPQSLDVLTMLGFVILIGTVVNNPILIVEQALVHIRKEGMHYRQAVLEAVRLRIRPIFMTTLTTVLGLLPLVLFPGAGSELYRGLGTVVLGGLLVSTVVTLIIVPAVFTLMLEAASLFGFRVEGKEEMEKEEEAPALIPQREAEVTV